MLMKPSSILHKWYLLVVAGGAAVVMLAFMFSGTLAQESESPAREVLWQGGSGSCVYYTVMVDMANVRSCAQSSCNVIEQVPRDSSLCVLGEAEDAAGWLRVDLEPNNAASPIYFVSAQVVASPAAEGGEGTEGDVQGDYQTCKPWLVSSEIAGVYACTQPGCAILGTMETNTWLCGNYYTSFPNWIFAVYTDNDLSGWVVREDVVPGSGNSGEAVPFVPTEVPSSGQGGTGIITPQETREPTVTPADGPLTIEGRLPACQQYFVSAQSTTVRACAGADCAAIASFEQGEALCVRGVTANPDWLIASLTSDNPDSVPLYAVEKANIMPGLPPNNLVAALFADCEDFAGVASVENVNYRQCPSENCPVLGSLAPGDWVCVQDYGGQYYDWMRADVPSGVSDVWINIENMKELTGSEIPEVVLVSAQFTPAPTVTETPLPAGAPRTSTPTRTPTLAAVAAPSETAASNETPAASVTGTVSTDGTPATTGAACVPYIVSVSGATGANVRSCAAVTCDVIEIYPQGSLLCVLSVDPEDTNWLIVEQTPNDDVQNLVYVNSGVVAPQDQPASVIGVTPQTAAPVVMPTATVQATLPICEPGSALAECVTVTPTPVLTPIPTSAPTGPLLAQEVKLSDLGVSNIKLESPVSSSQFDLAIPDDWAVGGSNVLYLNIEYSETISQSRNTEASSGLPNSAYNRQDLITVLDVMLDDDLAATISLNAATVGSQVLAIPLPLETLQNAELSHEISLELRAEDHCLQKSASQVFVRADQSYFHLEFRETIPTLDLSLYPRPLYTARFVNQAETVYLVLPENPTQNDMQVALALGAGLGSLTYNSVAIRVVTADTIDETIIAANNLLLVGEVGKNSLLDQYYAQNLFPSVLGADGVLSVSGQPVDASNGIVQIVANPLNERLAVVAVTGQSPEALVKAGTALAGPPSVMGIGGPVAIITDIRSVTRLPVGLTLESKMTFTDLGYPMLTIGGYGVTTAQVNFYLPSGYSLTDEAYVDLEFNHPGILNGNNASLSLTMNYEYPIASAYLQSVPTATISTTPDAIGEASSEITVVEGGPYHLRARIPADSVTAGDQNTLDISLSVYGEWYCYPPDIDMAWFTVSGNSVLNLPRARVASEEITPVVGSFPVPYNTQPDLRDVWFSLPDEPTLQDLEYAVRIAARLGSAVDTGEGFTPRLSLGNTIPDGTDLSAYNMILLGRHTTNSFLASLNESLPQPFFEGTDTLRQVVDDVTYQLPLGYEMGLLEIMTSPWSQDRVILVVSGTGATGEAYAVGALTDYIYGRSQLLGDVSYVSETNVSTVDTRALRNAEELANEIEETLYQLNLEATEAAQATAAAQAMATATTLTPTPGGQEMAMTITPYVQATTPAFITATSLYTPTVPPTVATAIPTFEPLPAEALAEQETEQPKWFGGALIAAGIMVMVTVAFALLRWLRGRRR